MPISNWKKFFVILICLNGLSFHLSAQYPNTPEGQVTGRLFSVSLDPKGKTLKIYGVGKPIGNIQFDGKKNRFEVTAIRGKQTKTLRWNQAGDFIEVNEMPEWQGPYEIRIQGKISESREKSETLKIKVP